MSGKNPDDRFQRKLKQYASDGIIEAIESKDARVLGVQWHPERLYETVTLFCAFFAALIDEARRN